MSLDWVNSSDIQNELGIEQLLLDIRRDQQGYSGIRSQCYLWRYSGQVQLSGDVLTQNLLDQLMGLHTVSSGFGVPLDMPKRIWRT